IINGTYTSSVTITVGTGAPVTIPITLNVSNTQSRVTATLSNGPIAYGHTAFIAPVSTDSGLGWRFAVTLTETNGVGTNVTTFKVAGQDISSQIPSLFGNATILPYESVTATVEVRNMLPYESVSIEIGGVDPGSGVTWSQTIPAEFTGAVGPSGGPIFGFGFPA